MKGIINSREWILRSSTGCITAAVLFASFPLISFADSPTIVPVSPAFCPYLTSYLRMDFNNDPLQVIRLQAFLKGFEKFDYVTINGVFDQATFWAVFEFQLKYQNDILKPWNISQPTGYVYVLTLGKINQIICGSPMTTIPPHQIIKDITSQQSNKVITPPEISIVSQVINTPIKPNYIPLNLSNKENLTTNYGKNLATAIFTQWQTPLGTISIRCLYELLAILIVLYIIGAVLEIVLYKNILKNVHNKFLVKWLVISLGSIMAMLGAYMFEEYCLILPLLVVPHLLMALLALVGWLLSFSKHDFLRIAFK